MKHFFKQNETLKEWNGATYFFPITISQTVLDDIIPFECCYGLEGNRNPRQPYASHETVLEQRAYSQEGMK